MFFFFFHAPPPPSSNNCEMLKIETRKAIKNLLDRCVNHYASHNLSFVGLTSCCLSLACHRGSVCALTNRRWVLGNLNIELEKDVFLR